MSYTRRPFNPLNPYQNQVVNELNLANDNFDLLAQAFVNNDPSTGKVLNAQNADNATNAQNAVNAQNATNAQNSDKVDGFDASLTPAPNVIVPLNSSGILDLSATYIKSNVYTFRRVDLSSATSDYMLQVGEEAYISFSNATSVPLHIATRSGTYYEMDIVSSNAVGTSGGSANPIYLNPNNTTYSNAFSFVEVFRSSSDSGVGTSAVTCNAFRIGWAIPSMRVYIINFTVNKHTKGLYFQTGVSATPVIDINSCVWNDTSTAWTSLGTITFPQSTSGYILVRRLA